MKWKVVEHKYVDDRISRYRPEQLSDAQKEGLKTIREALRAVSAGLPGLSFKSYAKGNVVWILMFRANHGMQETVASAKAKLSILDDAISMTRETFRERLEGFLRENDFEV